MECSRDTSYSKLFSESKVHINPHKKKKDKNNVDCLSSTMGQCQNGQIDNSVRSEQNNNQIIIKKRAIFESMTSVKH